VHEVFKHAKNLHAINAETFSQGGLVSRLAGSSPVAIDSNVLVGGKSIRVEG
jgi:hypothetical protein